MITKDQEKIVIDLEGKSLGRSASAAALALRGKHRADFSGNKPAKIIVEIKNVEGLKIGEKTAAKTYKRYSGYPSGLKETKFNELYKKDPQKVFLHALKGMLAKNKSRKEFLKNVVFSAKGGPASGGK